MKNSIRPVDKNNLDGLYGATAMPLEWPEDLSDKALWTIAYFDDTVALFLYRGKYIITDESGWLTGHGTGEMGDPMGFPRAEFDSPKEIGPWLETVANDMDPDEMLPGDWISD